MSYVDIDANSYKGATNRLWIEQVKMVVQVHPWVEVILELGRLYDIIL
jgi:hypothetical protein